MTSYPTHLASALTGAHPGRLRYWARPLGSKPPVLEPEYGRKGRFRYSFRDLIALRTFVYLREDEGLSLHSIRQAIQWLDEHGTREHMAEYRLGVFEDKHGKHVAWLPDDGDPVHLGRRQGGQQIHTVLLGAVFRPFDTVAGERVVDFHRPRPHLSVDRDVLAGWPVVRDTRVGYDVVAQIIYGGVAPERVKAFYPSVSPQGAREAWDFAQQVDRLRGKQAA